MDIVIRVGSTLSQRSLLRIVIGIIFLCSALTGLLPQTLLSVVIVGCFCVLLFWDELYIAFPFIIFYNSLYGEVFGFSMLRIYSMLLLASCIIRYTSRIKMKLRSIAPLTVYFLFLLLVLSARSIPNAVFAFIDIVSCFLVTRQLEKDGNIEGFFKVFVLVAFISFFTGILADNYVEQIDVNGMDAVSRFMGTFEDPNYMGFFYTIAIFSIIVLKLFPKKLRVAAVVLLYAMLLTSLSISAIVINALVWLIYLLVTKKISFKNTVIILLVALMIYSGYQYGLENPDTPVIGDISYRVSTKLKELQANGIDSATTNRTNLVARHMEFFLDQPLMKQFIGGTSVNLYYLDPRLNTAAHNEYVDLLLYVGILGTLIMLLYFFTGMVKNNMRFLKTGNTRYLFLFTLKIIWCFYAFTLTMFLDYRFVLFFVI